MSDLPRFTSFLKLEDETHADASLAISISEQYPDVHFIKFDVDELRDVAAELKIRAMPTFIMFKNGEKVEEFIGANPGQLAKLVEKHQK